MRSRAGCIGWESFGMSMSLLQQSQDLLSGMSAEESKKKIRDSLLAVSQRWDALGGDCSV